MWVREGYGLTVEQHSDFVREPGDMHPPVDQCSDFTKWSGKLDTTRIAEWPHYISRREGGNTGSKDSGE